MVEDEGSIRKAAQKIGISASYLSALLKEKRQPGKKVLKYLGLENVVYKMVMYREAE